jgi:hypothetical protein
MSTSRRYADNTTVTVDRSIAEIQKLVKAAGATNWSHAEDDDADPPRAMVQFKLEGWLLRFTIELPTLADMRYSPTGRNRRTTDAAQVHRDQEVRRRWREIALLIKAKLVAINSGVVSLDEEFLPYVVMQSGETVGQWAPAQLRALQASETLPLLPPATIEEVSG